MNQEKEDIVFALRRYKEQETAKRYVLDKKMQRPKTTFLSLVIHLFVVLVTCFLLLILADILFGPESFLSKATRILTLIILPLLDMRHFLVKVVECYQHYAKEETRRKCLCMPTCSEYAIEVLKKYCLVKALIKIRRRLFHTCRGGVYKIDPP